MHINGFVVQMLYGTVVTLELAVCALMLGLPLGLVGALIESIPNLLLRYCLASFIFIIRGLPEIVVLFFIYYGCTSLLSHLFHHYVNISAFYAGVTALGFIFGAYASEVFRGAFLAVDRGQIEAARALGFHRWQIFYLIKMPAAWRHAIPGLGNLWLVLLKDTAIVTLIGLADMMNGAKVAASTTHQPFTFYLIAALIYLVITSFSQQCLAIFTRRANRYMET